MATLFDENRFEDALDSKIEKTTRANFTTKREYTARVIRRDENGTWWVRISGNDFDTPVVVNKADLTPNDIVSVVIDTDKHVTIVDGNLSSPPMSAGSVQTYINDLVVGKLDAAYAEITFLRADYAEINRAVIEDADITNARIQNLVYETTRQSETISAHQGYIENLQATSLTAESAVITNLEAETAKIQSLTAEELTATVGYIADLTAENITTQSIDAAVGFIGTLTANNITAQDIRSDHATITTLDSTYATITNLTAATGRITNLESTKADITFLQSNYIDANTIAANYAQANLANVNNAWIQNGVIKDAAIGDAQILGVSANKLTAGTIDAGKINVANLRAKNLIVEKLNGQPVLGGYELVNSNMSGYSSKNPSTEGWYEYSNGSWVASTDTTVDTSKVYYKDAEQVSLYDQTYIDGLERNLNQRIDGAVETFTGTAVPTMITYPVADWSSSEYPSHVGDIYYVVNPAANENGYCYRFAYDNTSQSYNWVLIKDSDVTKALSDISDLQTFESETTSWIEETDEGLRTIRQNHTSLSGRVDNVESTANAALPASTFTTFQSTTFKELVDEVDEQSSTITSMSERVDTIANPNLSSFFDVSKDNADYWLLSSNQTDDVEDGWMTFAMTATSSDRFIHIRPHRREWVIPSGKYTLLVEFDNITITGTVQWSRKPNDAVAQIATDASGTASITNGPVYEPMTAKANAISASGNTALVAVGISVKANATFSGKVRVSLYEGEYSGPYKPYVPVTALTTLTQTVNSVKQTADTNSASIRQVTEKVENLQVGGRNLLFLTKDFGNKSGSTTGGYQSLVNAAYTSETYNGLKVRSLDMTASDAASYKEFVQYASVLTTKQDATYTFSFYAKGSGYLRTYFYPQPSGAVNLSCITSGGTKKDAHDGATDHTLTSEWKRYWVKWTAPGTVHGVRHVLIRQYKGVVAHVCGLMFEESDTASNWAPAPEDTDSQITTITTKTSTIEQTLDGVKTVIGYSENTSGQGSSTLVTKVNNIDETVDGHTQSIQSVKTTLMTGGRNLWPDADYTSALPFTNRGITVSKVGDGLYKALGTTSSTGDIWWMGGSDTLKVKPGDYTLSMTIESGTWPSSGIVLQCAEYGESSWHRNIRTVNGETSVSFTCDSGYYPRHIGFYSAATGVAVNVTFRVQLEHGSIATSWSAAPEDFATLSQDYANYKQTVNEFEATVGRTLAESVRNVLFGTVNPTVVAGKSWSPANQNADLGWYSYSVNYGAVAKTADGVKLTHTATGGSTGITIPFVEKNPIKAGEKLTLSFEYRGTLDTLGRPYILNASGSNSPQNNLSNTTLNNDGAWHTYTESWIAQRTSADAVAFLLNYAAKAVNVWFEVRDGTVILEHGDVAKRLSTAETSISSNATEISLRAKKSEVLGNMSLYTPLEYLQSSGTQYINTGVVPTAYPIRISVEVAYTSVPTSEKDYAGNLNTNVASGSAFVMGANGTAGKWYLWGGKNGWNPAGSPAANVKYAVDMEFPDANRRRVVIDGVEYTNYVDSYNSFVLGSNAIGLFAGAADRTYDAASVRIYSARIYNGGNLVRNLVPVKRISDSVLGMYDQENDVFYANAGTGSFTAGAESNWSKKIVSASAELSVQAGVISSKVANGNVISSINQSPESITINAARVNIDGASIFTTGRLSETSLNNAYDAKGTADKIKIGGRNYARTICRDISQTNNGVTVTCIGPSTIRLNGTSTGTVATSSTIFRTPILEPGKYSLWLTNPGNELVWFRLDVGAANTHVASAAGTFNKDNPYTFTVSTADYYSFYPVAKTGTTFSNFETSYMLEAGNKPSSWQAAPEDIPRPNLSPFFSFEPYNTTAGQGGAYWQSITYPANLTAMGDGWVKIVTRDNTSGTATTYDQHRPKHINALSPDTTYTLMVEFRNVSKTGSVFLRCPDGGQTSNSTDYIYVNGVKTSIDLAIANGVYYKQFRTAVSSQTNYDVFFGLCTVIAASSKATYEVRLSLYEGAYFGPYQPYAGHAVIKEQRIYYRSNSTTAPAAPAAFVTSTATANSAWSTKRMQYDSTYKLLYTTMQRKYADGIITCDPVLLDDTTTVIDGGNIITGTVTANQLNATNINASNILEVGALKTTEQDKILNSNIKLGGKNLAYVSNIPSVWERYAPTAYEIARIRLSEDLVPGEAYTFTLWGGPITRSDTSSCRYQLYWGGGNFNLGNLALVSGTTDVYRLTFTPSASSTAQHSTVAQSLVLYNTPPVGASGTTYSAPITKVMLEKGNIATDWTPAPVESILFACNFNNIKVTGTYAVHVSSNTNAPTTGHGLLEVNFDTGTPYQIWQPDSTTTAYYKRKYNTSDSTWTGWTSIDGAKASAWQGTSGGSWDAAAKTGTVTNFTTAHLVTGTTVTLRTAGSNNVAGLLTLNVQSTGAKNVRVGGVETSSSNQLLWHAGAVLTFTYVGSSSDGYWDLADPPNTILATRSVDAAATANKRVWSTNTVIRKGTILSVALAEANTAGSPALGVAVNSNGDTNLGYKPIYYGTSTSNRPTAANGMSWIANTEVLFTFDGANWRMGGKTYIDGGHILTESISADRIKVSEIAIGDLSGGSDVVSNASSALSKVNYYNQRCYVGQSGSTTTNPWYKFASSTISTQYVDHCIVFDVFNMGGFITSNVGSQSCGRLWAHFRANKEIQQIEGAYLNWENRGSEIDLSKFVLAYKVTAGTKIDVELWCKCDRSYSGYVFQVVYEERRDTMNETSYWTLYSAFTAGSASAVTSGYTTIDSTDMSTGYITRIDANGIEVHASNQPNNKVKINGDGLTVYKNVSNAAVDVAQFGSSARIGQDQKSRFTITNKQLAAYDDDNSLYFKVTPTSLQYGTFTAASESFVTGKGYQTSSQVSTAITNADANKRDWYAACPTDAATAAKVATIDPTTTKFSLVKGQTVKVLFSATNTGAVADLTLNVNSTGAKGIRYLSNGGLATLPGTNYLRASQIVTFTYDGSYWVADFSYNSNTYDRTLHNNYIKAAAAITSGKIICGTSSGYKNLAASTAFDISYPLLYASAAITSGAQAANAYERMPGVNIATTLAVANIPGIAANKVVFIKGTVSGTTFTTASANFLTCTLPTAASTDYYIPIGILANDYTSSATNKLFFETSKELWCYQDGAFGPTSIRNASAAAKTATNYLTTIDSNNGIQVHAANNPTTNYTQIDANGMDVVKGSTSVASFGTTTRIGTASGTRAQLTSTGMDIYNSSNQKNVSVTKDGMDVYENGTKRVSFGKYSDSYGTWPAMTFNGEGVIRNSNAGIFILNSVRTASNLLQGVLQISPSGAILVAASAEWSGGAKMGILANNPIYLHQATSGNRGIWDDTDEGWLVMCNNGAVHLGPSGTGTLADAYIHGANVHVGDASSETLEVHVGHSNSHVYLGGFKLVDAGSATAAGIRSQLGVGTLGTKSSASLSVSNVSTTSSAQTVNAGAGKTITWTLTQPSGYQFAGIYSVTTNHNLASSIGDFSYSSSNNQARVTVTNRGTANWTDLTATMGVHFMKVTVS